MTPASPEAKTAMANATTKLAAASGRLKALADQDCPNADDALRSARAALNALKSAKHLPTPGERAQAITSTARHILGAAGLVQTIKTSHEIEDNDARAAGVLLAQAAAKLLEPVAALLLDANAPEKVVP